LITGDNEGYEMVSRAIRQPVVSTGQLTLNLEPDMHEKYRCLRECIAQGIYQRGLGNVAIDLDLQPSNLSVQLSEEPTRRFSVDHLESYIEKTGDTTPIYYLISKFLAPHEHKNEDAATAQLKAMAPQLLAVFKQMGIA
jgi:hypothetical protein